MALFQTRSMWLRVVVSVVLLSLVVGWGTGSARVAVASDAVPTVSSATVVFGGDVVPHGDVLAAFEAHGSASLFGPIAPVLREADLALVNFETPAAPSRPVHRSGLRFNVHADFVQALAASGIDGVSVANNHAFDMGIAGVGETVTTLRSAGVRAIGGALPGEDPLAPEEFSLPGGRLCVFAATRLLNFSLTLPSAGQPRIALARYDAPGEEEALLAAVRRHRVRCGAIIVSLHSGVEYLDRPEPRDRVYFRRVAEAGADVVIGHHSHTPHPIEVYSTGGRQVPIFYSLGNFVSNQGASAEARLDPFHDGRYHVSLDPRTREGLLAVLRFEGTGNGRLRLAWFGYVPLWTVNSRFLTGSGCVPVISAALMPREGGGMPWLRSRWEQLVQRVGSQYLLAPGLLPGEAGAYRLSEEAMFRTTATAEESLAGSRDRSQH